MPQISVIIPAYNSQQYLFESISSVIEQNLKTWELLIIDDCSTDGSYEKLIEKYGSHDQINIFQTKVNSGAGVARNLGVEKANSRYLCFLDSDDIWLPNKLKLQLDVLQNSKYGICHTNYTFINECSEKISGGVSVSDLVDLNSYMKNTEIGMSTAMIDLDVVGNINFNPMRTRQDTMLWLSLLSKGHKSIGLQTNLVKYRIRKGQISGNKFIIALRTFRLFLTVSNIPVYKRVLNFIFYAKNAISKRS